MGFKLDEGTLAIKGRRGDSASLSFAFPQDKDISAYDITFIVADIEGNTIITKKVEKPTTQIVEIKLTENDTKLVHSNGKAAREYSWGFKVNVGIDFVQTIIPQEFNASPKFIVYPAIGEI